MEYCGIDLHQKNSEICVIDEDGVEMERTRFATSRKRLTRYFEGKPRMVVVIEAGGSSQWVSRLIEELGHEVVVCSPRRVRLIAESTLKSDEVDAEVLAQLGRLDRGFLGRVTHRSEEAQRQMAHLTVRSGLVKSRAKWVNTVRGILRGFGYKVPSGSTRRFHIRCDQVELPEDLRAKVQPMLNMLEVITEEIDKLEESIEGLASENPIVQHLQQVPGIGTIVAMYFVLSVDDPERFHRSRDVAAFFGLRPTMRGSADVHHYGRITKEGDPEMRRLLVQAAHALMISRQSCALKDWALKVAARRGNAKAKVALARKLAVLMHHLWITGETFQSFPNLAAA
jgi:transposase